jgi:hypothetical protein
VRFRDIALAMVDPHVTIHVQEAHQVTTFGNPQAGQLSSQLLGSAVAGQAGQLAPHGLDLWSTV